MQKYGVSGYPTVVFADPEGDEVEKLRGRSAQAVRSQILSVIEAHAAPTMRELGLDEGLALAAEEDKVLAVVFADEVEAADAVAMLIGHEAMDGLRDRFVWIRRPIENDEGRRSAEAKDLGARRDGTIVFLYAKGEAEDLGDRVLEKCTSPRRMKGDAEDALEEAEERAGG